MKENNDRNDTPEIFSSPAPLQAAYEAEQARIIDLHALRIEMLDAQKAFSEISITFAERENVLKAKIEELQQAFMADNAELIETVVYEKARMESLEKTLRSAIVADYKARLASDPEATKQSGAGMSVQVKTKYSYEQAAAVIWAKENAQMLIKIEVDTALFEKMIKQLPALPDFVKATPNVVAVIGKEK